MMRCWLGPGDHHGNDNGDREGQRPNGAGDAARPTHAGHAGLLSTAATTLLPSDPLDNATSGFIMEAPWRLVAGVCAANGK